MYIHAYMPFRRRKVIRKRPVRARARRVPRRRQFEGRSKSSPELLSYFPVGNVSPLPPRYRTKFTAEFYGSTTSGVGSGDYGWIFPMNSMFQPLNRGTTGLSIQLPSGASLATFTPTGLSQLLNGAAYTNYRVLSSKFEIDVVPQSIQDSAVVAITPAQITISPVSVANAMSQPYTKIADFSQGRPLAKGKIMHSNYRTMHEVMGVSPQAIENDLSASTWAGIGSDPSILWTWIVNMETLDNTQLNQPLEVHARITYWVELASVANASMVQHT